MELQDWKQEEYYFDLLRREDERVLWHPDLELVFLLEGTGRVCMEQGGGTYHISKGDIFVINSFQMVDLELDEGACALSLTLSLRFLATVSQELLNCTVDCRSFLYGKDKQKLFDIIRRDLAKLFQVQYKNEMRQSLVLRSRLAILLEDLVHYFQEEKKEQQGGAGWERLKAAVDYIQRNFKENISLEDLTQHTYLSRTYISHCFRRYLGVSFMEYLTRVRISHAVWLMQSKKTLTEISYESGFTNLNAMIRAFKNYRSITPGEYRQNQLETAKAPKKSYEEENEQNEIFSFLMQYAEDEDEESVSKEVLREITIDVEGRKPRVTPHWKRLINAGYAKDLTDGGRRQEVNLLQEKIGFEYIRVKGILDDEMCLIRKDMYGNIVKNFAYMDEVLDFILSVKAKPMIEFSQMPRLLARDDGFAIMRTGLLAYPSSMEAWEELVRSIMEHVVERYGKDKVKQWIFSPWRLPGAVEFGICTPEEYEVIYACTYRTIKSVCNDFIVCGPGMPDGRKSLKHFLAMCKKRDCVPDVISFRSFAAVRPEEEENALNLTISNESFPMAVSQDEDILRHTAEDIRRLMKEEGLPQLPLILEEWSNNIWQRDLCNDTCYKSAYLFKNALENNGTLNGMGYYAMNDRLDEIPPVQQIFCGGFGLFTKNGVKKSAYRAMELLAQMGDRLLGQGEGYFITRRDQEIQIFLYNYCHYDLLYRYRHIVNMSQTNRYEVFKNKETETFFIQLRHMDAGKYRIRRYGITREGGSSYDAWLGMGAPEFMDKEELEHLDAQSRPLYRVAREVVSAEEAVLHIRASVQPLEVWMIRISKE